MVKVVPQIGNNLLSRGNLTKNPDVSVTFTGKQCKLRNGRSLIARGTRATDKLYRTEEGGGSGSVLITTNTLKNIHISDEEKSSSRDEDN